ncbi:MAG: DUF2516 family protein [Actinomycetota bacterium]|nr:DUF2516 family protein [Actinomycetota bacterium]
MLPTTPTGLLFLVLDLGLFLLTAAAFVDCLRQDAAAFPAADKLTKQTWLVITGAALVLGFMFGVLSLFGAAAAVASIVYLVDVRPAVHGLRPGSGPYG